MSDCYERLHDFGSGHGAHQPLAEGETQTCRCGMSRTIRRGRLHYFRRRATQKKAA